MKKLFILLISLFILTACGNNTVPKEIVPNRVSELQVYHVFEGKEVHLYTAKLVKFNIPHPQEISNRKIEVRTIDNHILTIVDGSEYHCQYRVDYDGVDGKFRFSMEGVLKEGIMTYEELQALGYPMVVVKDVVDLTPGE